MPVLQGLPRRLRLRASVQRQRLHLRRYRHVLVRLQEMLPLLRLQTGEAMTINVNLNCGDKIQCSLDRAGAELRRIADSLAALLQKLPATTQQLKNSSDALQAVVDATPIPPIAPS